MSEINVYFRISEIIVYDIQNNFFGYLKYVPVLGYPNSDSQLDSDPDPDPDVRRIAPKM